MNMEWSRFSGCLFVVGAMIVLLLNPLKGQLQDGVRKYETLHFNQIFKHHIEKRSTDTLDDLLQSRKIVTFTAFGRYFKLNLYKQPQMFTNDMFAAEVDDKQSKEIFLDENDFYVGFLDGESRTDKTYAYWENNNLVATIKTRNDTYFVEPSWRHLPASDNYTMVVYRLSDVRDDLQSRGAASYCNSTELDPNNGTDFKEDENNLGSRNKRQSQSTHTRCSLMMVADYSFFSNMGQNSASATAKYMIGVITRINSIYTQTVFREDFTNLGFDIKGILVRSTATSDSGSSDYNVVKSWQTQDLLNAFSAGDYSAYCLAHLFTYTNFDNGVLGLAWVASSSPGSFGGICSPCSAGKCYNTGWSSSELNNQKILTLQADLVTAHELGHGWGSQHDPTDCAPSTDQGGKYIMYAYSVTGYNPNNNHFSSCSQTTIASVLQVKKESCFRAPSTSFCGNGKVEESEECDAGSAAQFGNDACCDNNCKLKAGMLCSDANSDCCRNCTYASASVLCRKSDNQSCSADAFCTGFSTSCPVSSNKPDNTACAYSGTCMNGTCQSICRSNGLDDCACDGDSSCFWCCKSNTTTCSPFLSGSTGQHLVVPDNATCSKGYCKAGVCTTFVSQTSNRLWDLITNLNIDYIFKFMHNNLVLATIILSLIPYIVFCIVICYVDYKKHKKDQTALEWHSKTNNQLTLKPNPSHIRVRSNQNRA